MGDESMPRVLWLALIAMSWMCATARADVAWSAGDLVCAGGTALARFTEGYNEDIPQYQPLPAEIDRARLSSTPGADRRDCKLSNGWEVRLRMGTDQAFPYGMGGAAPPEYFSLWVNRRKVVSRMTWAEGYEKSFDDRSRIVGVLVTDGFVTVCRRLDKSVNCERNQIAIERMTPDQVEYPPPGIDVPKPGTIVIARGKNNRLCRNMVRSGASNEIRAPNSIWGFPFSVRPGDVSEVTWIDPSPMTPIDANSWPTEKNGRVGQLDLDGNKRSETVVRFSGSSHYFDGSYWIVIDEGVSLASVQDEIFPAGMERDPEKAAVGSIAKQWHAYAGGTPTLYPGVSPRFIHLDGYTYRGRVYFLAHPTLLTHDPTAVLIRPLPKGKIDVVCSFQVVRPTF
jgi:hypothetical protein